MLAQIQAMFAVVDLGKINWNQFLEKYLEIAMSIIGKVIVSFFEKSHSTPSMIIFIPAVLSVNMIG